MFCTWIKQQSFSPELGKRIISSVGRVWWLTHEALLVLGTLRRMLASGRAVSAAGPRSVAAGGSSSARPSRTLSLNQDNSASLGSSCPVPAWSKHRMTRAQNTMTAVQRSRVSLRVVFQSAPQNSVSAVAFLILTFVWLCSYLGLCEVCKQKHFVAKIARNGLDGWDVALSLFVAISHSFEGMCLHVLFPSLVFLLSFLLPLPLADTVSVLFG